MSLVDGRGPCAPARPPDARRPRSRKLVPLSPARCIVLLNSRPVGQLVFTWQALPEIIPVNYRLDGDAIYVRLGADSVAARACRDTVVAFHVEQLDDEERTGWSVTAVGRTSVVEDEAERARIAALPLEPWIGSGRDHFLRISLDRLTGRQVLPDLAR